MTALTAETLRATLSYCRLTGIFRWRIDRMRVRAGAIAGHLRPSGYVIIVIDGEHHMAHRLAWLHVHGEWPTCEVDHRDLNPSNNSLANLREASKSLNKANQRCQSNNHCGVKGVNKSGGRYYARITKGGVRYHLGGYDSAELANEAYGRAATELFGEFARSA